MQYLKNNIVVMLVIAFFFITFIPDRPLEPDIKIVDVVYTNKCCTSVIIRGGKIIAGINNTSFDLTYIKFGLTAYLRRDPRIFSNRKKYINASLLFNDKKVPSDFTVTDGAFHDYVFIKSGILLNYSKTGMRSV